MLIEGFKPYSLDEAIGETENYRGLARTPVAALMLRLLVEEILVPSIRGDESIPEYEQLRALAQQDNAPILHRSQAQLDPSMLFADPDLVSSNYERIVAMVQTRSVPFGLAFSRYDVSPHPQIRGNNSAPEQMRACDLSLYRVSEDELMTSFGAQNRFRPSQIPYGFLDAEEYTNGSKASVMLNQPHFETVDVLMGVATNAGVQKVSFSVDSLWEYKVRTQFRRMMIKAVPVNKR